MTFEGLKEKIKYIQRSRADACHNLSFFCVPLGGIFQGSRHSVCRIKVSLINSHRVVLLNFAIHTITTMMINYLFNHFSHHVPLEGVLLRMQKWSFVLCMSTTRSSRCSDSFSTRVVLSWSRMLRVCHIAQ